MEKQGILVSGPALRPILSTMDLHNGCSIDLCSYSAEGGTSLGVPRRLADSASGSRSLPFSHSCRPAPRIGYGFCSQSDQVGSHSRSGVFLPGHEIQHSSLDRSALSQESGQTPRLNQKWTSQHWIRTYYVCLGALPSLSIS